MADKTNTDTAPTTEDTSAPMTFDDIIAAHGASIAGGRVFPEKYGARILAALSGDTNRVVIALPVAPFEDATMLDALDALDGITVDRTLAASDPTKVKAANTRGTVNTAAIRVKRPVHIVTLRNAALTAIAVSVTNGVVK